MRIVFWILTGLSLLAVSGCASIGRGMIDGHTYYSTDNPKIRIDLADDFEMNPDMGGTSRYEFNNHEERRYVLIEFVKRSYHDKSRIEHYYNPLTWIFYQIENCEEIDKGETKILGETWYYRDLVYHQSTASCSLVRDFGLFTNRQDMLKVLYLQDLPPYQCAAWKKIDSLDSKQIETVERFLKNMATDIQISNHTPDHT